MRQVTTSASVFDPRAMVNTPAHSASSRMPGVAAAHYPAPDALETSPVVVLFWGGTDEATTIDHGPDQLWVEMVLERVQVFTLAESLGGVESLVNHPAIMTHASLPAEVRANLGIDDALVRLSVGIEAVDDLIAELKPQVRRLALQAERAVLIPVGAALVARDSVIDSVVRTMSTRFGCAFRTCGSVTGAKLPRDCWKRRSYEPYAFTGV